MSVKTSIEIQSYYINSRLLSDDSLTLETWVSHLEEASYRLIVTAYYKYVRKEPNKKWVLESQYSPYSKSKKVIALIGLPRMPKYLELQTVIQIREKINLEYQKEEWTDISTQKEE